MSKTTATITATSERPKIAVLAPMAVTIRPTSPRDIMPQPTRRLRTQSIPEPSAARPQPTTLPIDRDKKNGEHQHPVARQRAIIARKADRDEK